MLITIVGETMGTLQVESQQKNHIDSTTSPREITAFLTH